jgi:hypothetical protein
MADTYQIVVTKAAKKDIKRGTGYVEKALG